MDLRLRNLNLALGAFLALGLATACGDDDDDGTDAGVAADSGTNPNPDASTGECTGAFNADTGEICEGFVAVNFIIDDSANATYTAEDFLAWKGSFDWDDETRILSFDSSWAAPYPLVFDDGAWDEGGHEPAGATAGDNIWGIAAFVEVPAAGENPISFEYGAIRNSDATGADGDWIWTGSNGTFDVAPGDTGEIDVDGLTIAAHGDNDLRLTIDLDDVRAFTVTTGTVTDMPFSNVDAANGVAIKSSAWGWFPVNLFDNGAKGDVTADDEVFTFVMSEEIADDDRFKHVGLLNSGDTPEWVFMFGPFDENGQGREYKGGDGNIARDEGVEAGIRTGTTGDFTPVTIDHAGNGNTIVTVP